MKRVLVVSPHPDDEAIGCGGAILYHRSAGHEVRTVFLTSGERGGHGRTVAETVRLREAEARAAAAILQVEAVEFWRQPDGRLRAGRALRERLGILLECWRPDLLYVTHGHEAHPDHRAAARLARLAVRRLDGALQRPAIRYYEVWTPLSRADVVLDISDRLEAKLAAVRAHASQCSAMRFDEAMRGLARYRGEMLCWPGGDYAEVFAEVRP
ncbi:MAG: PIG-L deacetylase family protein [Candidatus Latescibacterota bacterium]